MDYLDKAREQTVEALAGIDKAIEDAMLAQAPSSGIEEVEAGLKALRRDLNETLKVLDCAMASLERAKQDSS